MDTLQWTGGSPRPLLPPPFCVGGSHITSPPPLEKRRPVPAGGPVPGRQGPGVAERVGQAGGGVSAAGGGPCGAGGGWQQAGGGRGRGGPRVPQVPVPQPLQRQPLLAAALLRRGGAPAPGFGVGGRLLRGGGAFRGAPPAPPVDQGLGAVAAAGAGGLGRGGGRWGPPQLRVLAARPGPGGQPRGLRAGGRTHSERHPRTHPIHSVIAPLTPQIAP